MKSEELRSESCAYDYCFSHYELLLQNQSIPSFNYFLLILLLLLIMPASILHFKSSLPLFLSENRFLFNLTAGDYFKNIEKGNILEIDGGERGSMRGARRLLLGGPGSSPPRCAFKCGGCMPCRPVHVPVPPGTRVTMEYYPEAWRCKCGNKLYMP